MRYLLLALLLLVGCAKAQVDTALPATVPEQSPAPDAGITEPVEPGGAMTSRDSSGTLERDAASQASEVDTSCTTDADCAVKNVGNCCGYYPACVNRNSATFPERVKAECASSGMASICGFQEISACVCVEKKCQADGNGNAPVR